MARPANTSILNGLGDSDVFRKAYSYTRHKEAKASGLYPYFVPISESSANTVTIDGKLLIMAGSNNYLGYTHDPRVLEAAEKAARRYGTGCTGSRFLNGTLDMHVKLEHDLAKFCHKEAALAFSTGYQTNLGTISAITSRDDVIIIDKLDHASIVDGGRLALGEVRRFRHNDLNDLEKLLKTVGPKQGRLIVVDGVFSMEGDIAPLPGIAALAGEYGARLMVDEAHSVGVLGETGTGASEQTGILDQVDLLIGTFSKSFGSIGGYVAGDAEIIDYIKHTARSLIFSASMPPYAVATVQTALDLMQQEPERREHVNKIADRVRNEFKAMGLDTGASNTPIVPIVVGTLERTFRFWKLLVEKGVFTNPVVPPAVPETSCMLRTSYMATHTEEHIEKIVASVREVATELGVI